MLKIYKKVKEILKEETLLKYACVGVLILIGVCFLELFVFNYRHWQSRGNNPVGLEWTAGEGLEVVDYNTFRVINTELINEYGAKVYPYIEVTGLDTKVHNIKADFIFPQEGDYAVKEFDFHFELQDEGNAYYYAVPSKTFLRLVPQTQYNYLDTYGNLHAFKICFDNLQVGDIVRVNELTLNSIVPRMIFKTRMIPLALFLFILFVLRPGSFLYTVRIEDKERNKRTIKAICIIAMLAIEIFFTVWAIRLNVAFKDPMSMTEKQYMLMAEALTSGKTHLLIDPPEKLMNLADPYDFELRLYECMGDEPLWDVGYYNGHYFVYFGVAPIIIYYLTHYLLFGYHIRTISVVLINLILAILGIAALLYEMARRWYPKLPFAVYLMFTNMFTFGCGLIFLIMKPDFYAVPLSMAVALLMWGLFCFIRSIEKDKINPWLIALGSLLLALEAATRPQFLLASFLAILIFWNAAFKDRTLFSAKSIGATVGFISPYVIIAALVMFYNYDRFGNVLDFGANYNLTFNNMPYRGFRLDRLLHGTIGYLFYPCSVSNKFPFFDISNYISGYQGKSADEPLFGGLIYNNIILIIALFGFRFKKIINDGRRYIYVVLAPILAIAVAFIDANMAGVLTRYYNDFAWFLFTATFIIIGALIDAYKDNKEILKIIYTAIFVCFIISAIRIFLDLFGGDANPRGNLLFMWHTFEHLIEFWH